MPVLIAPDSFKGSIGAADALAEGWRSARPVTMCPGSRGPTAGRARWTCSCQFR